MAKKEPGGKTDRREEIVALAGELFSQRGYEAVSMRNIADALEMSVGNLTYYFKQKEALVEAVLLRAEDGYKRPMVPVGLAGLHRLYVQLLKKESDSAFYLGFSSAEPVSDAVKAIREGRVRDYYSVMREGFHNLERAGFIQKEEAPGVREQLFHAMRVIVVHRGGVRPGEKLAMLWGVTYPLLTPRGRRAYKNEVGA